MFKAWHVFAASLVFLALVLTGATIGSMNGIDSRLETFPTRAPEQENEGPPPTAVPGATQIELVAANIQWETDSLTAAAGQPVQLTMDNRDAGVPHNFSLYGDRSAAQTIFKGELLTGPGSITYEFDAPKAGNYFFRCDVHPDMAGAFTAQ